MLSINNFDLYKYTDDSNAIVCYVENTGRFYHITQDGRDFVIDVFTLDENGEAVDGPRYINSSLSAAIAQIEAMENGEEV